MWGGQDHPGPKGEQLRDVAKYLRWLQEAGGEFGSLSHAGKLVAVFWDWASLYQDKPFFDPRRTEEQTRMFKSGLQNVNLWYCHPNTLTLMNRKTPAGRQWSYDDSGCGSCEASSSLLLYVRYFFAIAHHHPSPPSLRPLASS